jgi:hypothetical protein
MQLKVSNGSVHLKSGIITLFFWYNKLLTFSGSDINPNGIKIFINVGSLYACMGFQRMVMLI